MLDFVLSKKEMLCSTEALIFTFVQNTETNLLGIFVINLQRLENNIQRIMVKRKTKHFFKMKWQHVFIFQLLLINGTVVHKSPTRWGYCSTLSFQPREEEVFVNFSSGRPGTRSYLLWTKHRFSFGTIVPHFSRVTPQHVQFYSCSPKSEQCELQTWRRRHRRSC